MFSDKERMGWPNNVAKFLSDQGLQNLTETFIAEEIEVTQIPGISDQDLIKLGVRTIGARMRIRSAATVWVEPEMICCFSEKLAWQMLLCISSHQIIRSLLSHILHFVDLCKSQDESSDQQEDAVDVDEDDAGKGGHEAGEHEAGGQVAGGGD